MVSIDPTSELTSQKPAAESLSKQCFACQTHRERSCCVTGMKNSISGFWKTTVTIGPPLLLLIALSHMIQSQYFLCGPHPCSLQGSQSCVFWPDAHGRTSRRLWGSLQALLQPVLWPWRHSRLQFSCPKFLLLQPTAWMLCFLGDKGSLPRKVTQQSSARSLSWDKGCSAGPEGSGISGQQSQAEKTVRWIQLHQHLFREIGYKHNQQGESSLRWQRALLLSLEHVSNLKLIIAKIIMTGRVETRGELFWPNERCSSSFI